MHLEYKQDLKLENIIKSDNYEQHSKGGCDTKSQFFLILINLFSFNFIYYEVQSFIIDINICGCFIHGFER